MRVLALEPYHGGSHQAFLENWIAHSRHTFTLLELPANKWKWRMRHASLSLSKLTNQLVRDGAAWDAVWASDMLNLAEYRALVNPVVSRLPAVLYFHENQFTYPNRNEQQRDHHFAFTNYLSAVNADRVWFNSDFHRTDFLTAVRKFLERMPDYRETENVELMARKSSVYYPGCLLRGREKSSSPNVDRPIQILWSARWEHDKNPELFFDAMDRLQAAEVPFRLNVLGQSFAEIPVVFEQAKSRLASRIDRWGFVESEEEYFATLRACDVLVSTAEHEFFGMAAVEAMGMGVVPLLPNRLSYPELLSELSVSDRECCLYSGDVSSIVNGLRRLALLKRGTSQWNSLRTNVAANVARFEVATAASRMDDGLESITG